MEIVPSNHPPPSLSTSSCQRYLVSHLRRTLVFVDARMDLPGCCLHRNWRLDTPCQRLILCVCTSASSVITNAAISGHWRQAAVCMCSRLNCPPVLSGGNGHGVNSIHDTLIVRDSAVRIVHCELHGRVYTVSTSNQLVQMDRQHCTAEDYQQSCTPVQPQRCAVQLALRPAPYTQGRPQGGEKMLWQHALGSG
eukprot:SAG31_NODE_2618_length_5366_cov_2.137650_4_plen_194_part_00